jgi:hypothetical protein
MQNKLVVNKHKIINRKSTAPYFIRKTWVWFHLTLICPYCPERTWRTRDILDEDICYWKQMWQKGVDDIPLWMGKEESLRLKKLNEELVKQGNEFVHISSIESVLHKKFIKNIKHTTD